MTKNNILCFGELFIDMFAHNEPGDTHTCFYQHAGGSPAIVAYAIAGYGGQVQFAGKLSDDHFAEYLVDYMKAQGVGMDYAIRSAEHRCTISFVRRDENGEREFEIYRDSAKAADLAFSADEWQAGWFDDVAVLQLGSNCQVSEASHLAHVRGAELAVQAGSLVSYDPNIRPNIWADHDLMRRRVHEIFPYSTIIKMSDDEAELLFPGKSEEQIAQELFAMKCEIMLITRGGKGASIYHPQHETMHFDPITVAVVDTTGAGDNFIAACLYKAVADGLLETGLAKLSAAEVYHLGKFAQTGASLSVTQRGGMDSSPDLAAVKDLASK